MTQFDPNAAASKSSGIFGLPFSAKEAALVLLPVPWDATTSYGGGASHGPCAIFNASKQIDLFDKELGNFFEAGIFMQDESQEVRDWNEKARHAAKKIIDAEILSEEEIQHTLNKVNTYSKKLNEYVYQQTKSLLNQGKKVGLVGGDHATPLGAIQAHLEKYPDMSMLHIDAHADLRDTFEGFEYSHASIMHNVITKTPLKQLVQVGIRDFCEEEVHFIEKNSNRITTFFDLDLAEKKLTGESWSNICDELIKPLAKEVYISLDIDGLDPRFCPHTGTPVPGGLDFNEVLFLFKKVIQSGRKIIGFDVNEVSPGMMYEPSQAIRDAADEWDANVGARLLYKLCGWTIKS